jgi:23S rRNA pseudouridine2605 synthase
MEERLQKILAQAGFGSRRSCEDLITSQRVRVNGKMAELGSKADSQRDMITVDGQSIPKIAAHLYIALNKPREILSDIDPKDPRQTVHDLVKVPGHLFAVGRLDYDSEGLILLTNDGELANRLTHPRYGHEKEYRVLVATRPDDEQLATWRRGVVLADGYRTKPAEVAIDSLAGKGAWLRVILREGRKRQIREVGGRVGLHVQRIMRIRIGNLLLGELKVGEWRYLTNEEIRKLKAGVSHPEPKAFPDQRPSQRPRSRPTSGSYERSGSNSRPGSGERPGSNSRSGSGERSGSNTRPGSYERPSSNSRSGSSERSGSNSRSDSGDRSGSGFPRPRSRQRTSRS